MRKSMGRFHSLVVPLFTWLILLVPFLFYQRYYVASQQAYLTEHGFRLLAAVGRQLDAYVDSIDKTVLSAQRRQKDSKGKAFSDSSTFVDYLRTFHDELRLTQFPTASPNATCAFSVEFGPPPAPFQRCVDAPFSGRLSLDSPIRERLRGIGEDYFDDVLIANSNGDVLFQRSVDMRVTTLDPLVRAAGGPPSTAAEPPAASKSNPTRDFAILSTFSSVLDITLAGGEYKLFLEPLRLSPSGSAVGGPTRGNDGLVLAGLWRTDRLNSESSALPYSIVIWFGLICVAAVSFVWPFLKINYMSHTERLRRSHGWLLVFSMFLGTASVTLMVLNNSYLNDVRADIDADLETLAKQIQKNVKTEIGLALMQSDQLGQRSDVREASAEPFRSGVLKELPVNLYPYFNIAFWADKTGDQRVKFTVDRHYTPQTSVKERTFFREVTANRTVSLEPTLNPNTGQFTVVMAAPFNDSKSDITVQALVGRPLSLVDPVLPPDFGFAILARDGRVLFHSNPLRNLSEDFIRECKDPSALQAALFSESDQKLDIVYSGLDRRALVTKIFIPGLGPQSATLVVFHNTEVTLTLNMAIILIGAVLMTLYTSLMLLPAAIVLHKYLPEWIWPSQDYSLRCTLVCGVNGVLVLVFLLTYARRSEVPLLFLMAGILLCAAAGSAAALLLPLPAACVRWNRILEPHFKGCYVAATLSVLVAVTAVPSFGFFKFSHDAASELAAKHGQLRVMRSLLDRDRRIDALYRDLRAPREYATARIAEDLDRYDTLRLAFLSYGPEPANDDNAAPEDNAPKSSDAEPPIQHEFDLLLQAIAVWFPSNTVGSEMRMLHFDPGAANADAISFRWSEPQPNKKGEIFRLEAVGKNVDQKNLTVDSQFAEWGGVSRVGWSCLVLLWVLLGGWCFRLMKNIFLPDSQKPVPLERVNWQSRDDITANALVLVGPLAGRSSRLATIPGLECFDVRVGLEALDTRTFRQGDVVALDHFDFNFDNRSHNQTRLLLLERLLYKDRCRVVVVSSIDPVYYLSDADPAIFADTRQSASEWLERWTTVMSGFQKVAFQDVDRSRFDQQLDQRDPRKARLAGWIDEECRHTAYLRHLGLALFQEHQREESPDFRALLDDLVDRSDAYYSLLWSTLTARERLALYQLAKDGWANTKNQDAIVQLQRRGLVRCDAMRRVMNESFRRFALRAQDQREIVEWERQGRDSAWHSLKIAFIAASVGLTAWLFYAQQDLFQVSIGYVVTLGGAVAAISNLLGGFGGRAASAPKAPAGDAS